MPSMPKEYYREYRKVKATIREIVAWDGEGVTHENGEHDYNMLANSKGDVLEREKIGTKEALDFLLAHRYRRDTLHVCFVGSYDVGMILKELSGMVSVRHYPHQGKPRNVTGKQIITYIYKNETNKGTRFKLGDDVYEVMYRPRKFLKLSRFFEGGFYLRKGKRYTKNAESMTLWDVFGFSQSSFVAACKKYKVLDETALLQMQGMKDDRSTFTEADRARVREYCISECRALAELYRKQLVNFRDADLLPARHDGPGALASKLLQKHSVKAHIVLEPLEMRVPSACAFFGGRIELCKFGYTYDEVFGHDIASAYPAAATDLPSLHGTWSRGTLVGRHGCYKLRYRFRVGLPWYPLPYRDHRGYIRFADEGEGWYWTPEVEAALRFCVQFGGDIEILEGWTLQPETHDRPFAFIPGVFELRRKWKQEGNGAEGALKLAINSCYGQLARQIGGSLEKMPPFFSLVWAGMITSATRARLIDLAMTDPQSIIAFATDGIYTTRPLKQMDLPPREGILGTWESSSYTAGVFVQAGVYWLQKGQAWEAKFRGFDRKHLETPGRILDSWECGAHVVPIPTTRFLSHKAALVSPALWEARGTWISIDRKLDLTGGSWKRASYRGKVSGLHDLRPNMNSEYLRTEECSHPYDAITLKDHDEAAEDENIDDILDADYA